MLGGEVLEGVDTDVQMQAPDSQDSQVIVKCLQTIHFRIFQVYSEIFQR